MKRHNIILRVVYFCGGIFIVNLGASLLILSDLGTNAWNVFHLGLARYLPLTVGRITQGVGAIMVLFGWALKIKPTWGTFANMYLFGSSLDIILQSNLIKPPPTVAFAWIYNLLGTLIAGVGFGIYLNGNLGAGPRDSFMLGVAKFTGKTPGTVKTIMEGSAIIIGWLLGGPVGLGTIVYTALVGAIMQWTLDYLKPPERSKSLTNSQGL